MPKRNERAAFARSDLACEGARVFAATRELHRVERYAEGFHITELEEAGGGYPSGRYVTADIGRIWLESDERAEACVRMLAGEIEGYAERLCAGKPRHERCILAAGLGNRFITADSLGPLTVDKLTVTRHMTGKGGFFDTTGCSELCAVQTGVLGQTGIETALTVAGAVAAAGADLVIAVDALAARSVKRLATTVQLSDLGIRPGSGLGNRRLAVDADSVGCPVLSIGVPTVVDSATLVCDMLERAGITELSPSLCKELEEGLDFFVAPKECDLMADELSTLLSRAICLAAGI